MFQTTCAAPEKTKPPTCGQVMVDIETMGRKRGCAILTIGACAFDYKHDEIGEEFYINILPTSNTEAGLDVDIETVLWWSQQEEEARKALVSDNAVSLAKALDLYRQFLVRVRENARPDRIQIWSNDPEFDSQILEGGYDAVNATVPWQFWENRSMRTIIALAEEMTGKTYKKLYPRGGTYHNALDDCKYQIQLVKAAYNDLFK